MDLNVLVIEAVKEALHEQLPEMMRPPAIEPRLAFTVAEAADQLRIGKTLMKELVRTGAIRSRKIGDRRVIPASALLDFLETEDEGCQDDPLPVVEEIFGARDGRTTRAPSSSERTAKNGQPK